MKNENLTSSKPDYSWLILGLTALICACLLSCCQTKKKAQHIEKSEQSQSSDVKKEYNNVITDSSATSKDEMKSDSSGYQEEETTCIDSLKTHADGSQTAYGVKTKRKKKGEAKKEETKKETGLNVKSVTQVGKVDSSGKSQSKVKSKVQDKEVTDNLTSKASAVGFLILVVLIALWYIRKQQKAYL